MGHSTWRLKIPATPGHEPRREEMIAYVRGYILALEDVIKDLRGYWELTTSEARLYHSIQETQKQAQATLDILIQPASWDQPTTEEGS